MDRLLDQILLFLLCTVWYLESAHGPYAVAPLLAAVTVSALMEIGSSRPYRAALFGGFCLFVFFFPAAASFFPMVFYRPFFRPGRLRPVLAAAAALYTFEEAGAAASFWVLLLCLLSFALRRRTEFYQKARAEAFAAQDRMKEAALELREKNRALMEKREYEVRLATLKERNRISRDLHDTIGHLLSSSLLQIGALMTVTQEEPLRESLLVLKDTLSKGLDTTRAALHNLYDQSVSLEIEAQKLADGFLFCPLRLEYDVEKEPAETVRLTLVFVLKEALANIVRHSNATAVHVVLREHPGFYQLIVRDNGSKAPSVPQEPGLGLRNITERVEDLGGHVRFDNKDGFLVFATIPREAVG